MTPFRVAVDRGVRERDGVSAYPLDMLEEAGLEWRFVDELARELAPADVDGRDAVILFRAAVTPATLDCARPPLVVARLGAGYDRVAVDACTERGVLVTTAPDGVRRPMASAGMAFLLALAHRLVEKDRQTRSGDWDRDAVGPGLTGRTLGVLGLGNIGRDLCGLAAPFGLRRLGHDPYAPPPDGVEPVDLDTLLGESDFLVVTLPLTAETRGLLNAQRLAQMKPTAYLVNIARGPIVDQAALTAALLAGRLAGAALDVFEQEPLPASDPLLRLDNVVVASHAIGLTVEMIEGVARSACRSVLDVAGGRVPRHTLNPEALTHPRLASLQRA